jgi:hypothetical protein
MVSILEDLGDDRASRRPQLPGANTPYGIVTHCLGVLEFWVGRMVVGRETERDREAEFKATGAVNDLVARSGRRSAGFAKTLLWPTHRRRCAMNRR